MVIKYFSWVKELAETSEEQIELPDNIKNVEELIKFLIKKNKKYEKIFVRKNTIKIAVNKVYTNPSSKITNNDEIAFFPPVTGG
tara:strand:+ start:401 stop:652 length:252 start_codon:yes stop_codon:yes gene_type:complete